MELKPCPVCGADAAMYKVKHIPYGVDYVPMCTNFKCMHGKGKRYACKEIAEREWNRRKDNNG